MAKFLGLQEPMTHYSCESSWIFPMEPTVGCDTLKTEVENPTIGLLLCKSKSAIIAEYALRGMAQPIGIAEYEINKAIPKEIKSELPTIEEIELATIKAIRNVGDSDKSIDSD